MTGGRVLITGGAGFIGSHLVRRILRTRPDLDVVVLDALTYAGRLENLADVADSPNLTFMHGGIAEPEVVERAAAGCAAIINVAAETHVDRSIFGGDEFILTNVLGTKRLLDWARDHPGTRFVQVSTDEVYGDVEHPHRSSEGDPMAGSSPYAASKAAADLLVLAYVRTYGVDASITRGANTFGPYQFPEKLIPLFITNALDGHSLPVYGDGRQVREFLFVEDHCAAIELVSFEGERGRIYNVGPDRPQANIETARAIVELTGADPSLIVHVPDRPGHDRRYAVATTALRALGWEPSTRFEDALKVTVDWFRDNRSWWEPIKAGAAFAAYVERNYRAEHDDRS